MKLKHIKIFCLWLFAFIFSTAAFSQEVGWIRNYVQVWENDTCRTLCQIQIFQAGKNGNLPSIIKYLDVTGVEVPTPTGEFRKGECPQEPVNTITDSLLSEIIEVLAMECDTVDVNITNDSLNVYVLNPPVLNIDSLEIEFPPNCHPLQMCDVQQFGDSIWHQPFLLSICFNSDGTVDTLNIDYNGNPYSVTGIVYPGNCLIACEQKERLTDSLLQEIINALAADCDTVNVNITNDSLLVYVLNPTEITFPDSFNVSATIDDTLLVEVVNQLDSIYALINDTLPVEVTGFDDLLACVDTLKNLVQDSINIDFPDSLAISNLDELGNKLDSIYDALTMPCDTVDVNITNDSLLVYVLNPPEINIDSINIDSLNFPPNCAVLELCAVDTTVTPYFYQPFLRKICFLPDGTCDTTNIDYNGQPITLTGVIYPDKCKVCMEYGPQVVVIDNLDDLALAVSVYLEDLEVEVTNLDNIEECLDLLKADIADGIVVNNLGDIEDLLEDILTALNVPCDTIDVNITNDNLDVKLDYQILNSCYQIPTTLKVTNATDKDCDFGNGDYTIGDQVCYTWTPTTSQGEIVVPQATQNTDGSFTFCWIYDGTDGYPNTIPGYIVINGFEVGTMDFQMCAGGSETVNLEVTVPTCVKEFVYSETDCKIDLGEGLVDASQYEKCSSCTGDFQAPVIDCDYSITNTTICIIVDEEECEATETTVWCNNNPISTTYSNASGQLKEVKKVDCNKCPVQCIYDQGTISAGASQIFPANTFNEIIIVIEEEGTTVSLNGGKPKEWPCGTLRYEAGECGFVQNQITVTAPAGSEVCWSNKK